MKNPTHGDYPRSSPVYNWKPRQALGERPMTVSSLISVEHPRAEIYVALTGGWLLPETLSLSLPMAKRASLKG